MTVHYWVEAGFRSALSNLNSLSGHKLGFLPAVLYAELCILWFPSKQKNFEFFQHRGTFETEELLLIRIFLEVVCVETLRRTLQRKALSLSDCISKILTFTNEYVKNLNGFDNLSCVHMEDWFGCTESWKYMLAVLGRIYGYDTMCLKNFRI